MQLQDLGEHCKLKFPQRGLGQSRSRQVIWCILPFNLTIGGNNFSNFPDNQQHINWPNFVHFMITKHSTLNYSLYRMHDLQLPPHAPTEVYKLGERHSPA